MHHKASRSISSLIGLVSQPSSPILGNYDLAQDLKSGLRSPTHADLSTSAAPLPRSRRDRLASLWTRASPLLVAALLVALYHQSDANEYIRQSGSINAALRCAPRSEFSSVEAVCSARAAGGLAAEEFEVQAGRVEVGMDRQLTQGQCDAVYPGLFYEVERARDYYAARGGVTEAELDEAESVGQARVIIKNNRLYVKSYHEDRQQGTRTKAVLASINEAIVTAREPIPDIEFVIQTGDNAVPHGAPWALGRREDQEQVTLIPDYGFFSWPEPQVNSFLEVQDKTLEFEKTTTWKDKLPQLFWRGALMVDIRRELVDISSRFDWGRDTVGEINWFDKEQLSRQLLTPEQHCGFKYLAHAEGFAYSGRLKYLQQCRSVTIAHTPEYVQHWHHLWNSNSSSPDQNIVLSPGRNFDELPATMDALMADDARAERIADTSFKYWRRWLAPGSIDCYWRRLFAEWAEVQTWEPKVAATMASYNSFILLGKTEWVPY